MEQWQAVKQRGHIVPSPAADMIVPSPKRVRVVYGGEVIADSARVQVLREPGHLPLYYLPRDDARFDRLTRTAHATHCPRKGDAAYFSIAAGGRTEENAVWTYESPRPGFEALAGHLAFEWARMDAWYEEDEQVFVHARDPFVRVDVLPSARPVIVRLAGEVVARSTRALFLFETGLPTRHYLPREDVRMALLQPSDARTRCPYKGIAHYWHARIGEQTWENLAWSYPHPVHESARIRDHLCFYAERVDGIEVAPPDGALPDGALPDGALPDGSPAPT